MPRSYTEGQLNALLALLGGVDAIADELDLDEDAVERLFEGGRVSEDFQDDFDNALRKWKRREPDLAETVDRVAGVLDWYPEILEIIDNDGVAEALIKYPKFADIFYKDATVYESKTPETYKSGKKKGQPRRYTRDVYDKRGNLKHEKGDIVYKKYSDGGLYPGAIQVIIDYATKTKKGEPRKRGQVDLSPMINALIEDDFEIGLIDDSAFWRWFREIYGD